MDILENYECEGQMSIEDYMETLGIEKYTIDSVGRICAFEYLGDKHDAARESIGNIFDTREEAEFALERLKVIRELKELGGRRVTSGWCLKLIKGMKTITPNYTYGAYFGTIAFASFSEAMKAIETIGEDRIIKYYLEVKDNG